MLSSGVQCSVPQTLSHVHFTQECWEAHTLPHGILFGVRAMVCTTGTINAQQIPDWACRACQSVRFTTSTRESEEQGKLCSFYSKILSQVGSIFKHYDVLEYLSTSSGRMWQLRGWDKASGEGHWASHLGIRKRAQDRRPQSLNSVSHTLLHLLPCVDTMGVPQYFVKELGNQKMLNLIHALPLINWPVLRKVISCPKYISLTANVGLSQGNYSFNKHL